MISLPTYVQKEKTSKVFGSAFLGNKAYKEVKKEIPKGYKPPSKGYDKPFDYKLWNTLRRLGRVNNEKK